MSNRFISTFFSIIFTLFLTTPMVVTVLEKSFDVSMYFNMNEEEKNNEKSQDTEILFLEVQDNKSLITLNERENDATYFYKKYPKPHLNLISPPPEKIIL